MKFLRLLCLMLLPFIGVAQKNQYKKPDPSPYKKIIREYLVKNQLTWKLTDSDINEWVISDLYSDDKSGITYLYVHQQVNGIHIFNAVSSVSVKDNVVKTFARRIYPDASSLINTSVPGITAADAIQKAAQHLALSLAEEPKLISSDNSTNRYYFSSPAISNDKIRVQLVYQPIKKNLRLAWDVSINLIDNSHWWNIRVDAVNGEFIQKNDWTRHCDFGTPESSNHQHATPAPVSNSSTSQVPVYRVYPLPIESPGFGPSSLLSDPADPVASPFGWHDTNGSAGAEHTITRGNNVYAYDDIADNDAPGTSPNGTSALNFDFPANLSLSPSTYLDASVTNLFYVNNYIHDVLYHNGFTEAAGNFQENNYGNGGNGQDYVIAECQDGGGSNNANFATPDDGQNGRMQMYLWSGVVQSVVEVNNPSGIAGNYTGVGAGFGPPVTSPITADLVLVDDATGVTSDACEPLVNGPSLSGKIALIDRGTCDFVSKVLSAQNEGAVAVLVINNTPGLLSMGDNGNGAAVTIPSLMISLADGTLIKNTLIGDNVNATLNPPPSSAVDIDGSFDNGIVVHEYGHGVSNRLTGGPMNSNCLFNGEQGGEGWSDYFALLFTMKPGDVGTAARGVGTFALGQPPTGSGIRRYPYSTDMGVNPETYGFLAQSPQVHDIGEVWCVTLWEMTWGLIDQFGFDPDWINGTSGNNIALKLVMEGMKLQPCGPGFLDSRDAILLADDNLYGGIHKCIIWDAFAKRGMGFNADQGDADIAGDETEDFDLPPLCLTPVIAPTADFNADITTTCFGVVHFEDLSSDIPQSWMWDFGDGNTSTLQNPVHTYANAGTYTVTLTVANTIGSDSFVRNAFITVSRPAQPIVNGNTVICSGQSATLTANIAPGNDIEWRDANDSLLSNTTIFNTPSISSNTAFFVTQFAPTSIQFVGPSDNNFGTGSYHNTTFEGKLNFTTLAPLRLKSVWVDANGTSTRTINLYSQPGNNLILSMPVQIPAGQGRVDLNIDIPTTGNYQIGVAAGSDLYRNNDGASYPYSINGLVNITSSNSTTNPAIYYYYLYDWEVQELPCTSTPLPVNITIDPDPTSGFTVSGTGLNVQFTNTSTGNITSQLWDFGDGNNSVNASPFITYSAAGTYTVTLTVNGSNGCQSVYTQQITVPNVGVEKVEVQKYSIFTVGDNLHIEFPEIPDNALIRVYDPIGKLIFSTTHNEGNLFRASLHNVAAEIIFVNITENENNFSKKVPLFVNR